MPSTGCAQRVARPLWSGMVQDSSPVPGQRARAPDSMEIRMRVHHLQLLRGSAQARGLAVVIDVFRAASHIVTLFARGAESVIPVDTVEAARTLKKENPTWLLAGEREGLPPPGFDLGNSPAAAEERDFTGRTVILTTSAGTRGLVAASQAAEGVIVGCFLNAQAVIHYIQTHRHDEVSIVALGVAGETPAPEDNLCAQFLELGLTGFWPDPTDLFRQISEHPEGRKFLDPGNPNYPAADLHACLRTHVYDVVPVMQEGRLVKG